MNRASGPLLLAALALAACAPSPTQLGAHIDTRSGQVSPSLGTRLGPVSLFATG